MDLEAIEFVRNPSFYGVSLLASCWLACVGQFGYQFSAVKAEHRKAGDPLALGLDCPLRFLPSVGVVYRKLFLCS